MECHACHRGFCYDVMGAECNDSVEQQACVTVPREMVNEQRQIFRCPECLSLDKYSLPDVCMTRFGVRRVTHTVVVHHQPRFTSNTTIISKILASPRHIPSQHTGNACQSLSYAALCCHRSVRDTRHSSRPEDPEGI